MGVQSIERAFALLRVIAEHQDGISVTDLARQANLHKSTVSRLVMSLETEQAIVRENGFLYIGDGITALLSPALHSPTLKSLAHPFLRHLTDSTHETAGLCIPDGDHAYFIDQILTEQTIQIQDWTGSRFPLHAVSSGKLFLAYGYSSDVDKYLAQTQLTRYAANTIVDPELLRLRLKTIRQQGYDWAFEEFSDGLVVVSAPIFDGEDSVIASIYICGPRFRFPPTGKQDEIRQLVVDAGQQLTAIIQQK